MYSAPSVGIADEEILRYVTYTPLYQSTDKCPLNRTDCSLSGQFEWQLGNYEPWVPPSQPGEVRKTYREQKPDPPTIFPTIFFFLHLIILRTAAVAQVVMSRASQNVHNMKKEGLFFNMAFSIVRTSCTVCRSGVVIGKRYYLCNFNVCSSSSCIHVAKRYDDVAAPSGAPP